MNKAIKILFLLSVAFMTVSGAFADDITKEIITKVPDEISANLIGMRVYNNIAYIMSNNGQYITVDLATGDTNSYKLEKNDLLDFDVANEKLVYLDSEGKINGSAVAKWSNNSYDACFISACDQGLILTGGSNGYFLPNIGTESVVLPETRFCLPIENGFMWSMACNDGIWEACLYDCFGNLMKKVYRFSQLFKPSNLEIGPHGIEGELLVSAIENNKRTLSLIGNNGRMFWKINGPDKVCNRDVAFDKMDNLVALERNSSGEVILNRYTFIIPEG